MFDVPLGGESARVVPFARRLVPDKGYESGLPGRAVELSDRLDFEGAVDVRAVDGGFALVDDRGRLVFVPSE